MHHISVHIQRTIATRGLHRRYGSTLFVPFMEIDESSNINIRHTIPISETKGLFVLDVLGDTFQAPACECIFTSINQRDTPWFGVPLDRKSTRLNSSHQKISYAVFC